VGGAFAERMSVLAHTLKILILLLAPCSLWGALSPLAKKPYQQSVLFYSNAEQLVTKQAPEQAIDQIYQTYFGNTDAQIALIYQDQFQQHDQNLPFRSSSWRGEFISNSVASGNPTYDWQARQQLAKQVLRMRVDQGVRETLKSLNQSPLIAKAQGALEAVQNVSVPVASSEEGKPAAQLRLGYDVISDSSRIEVVGGAVDVGVYKNGFLANPGDTHSALMTVSSDLGPELGRASVSMPLSAQTLQTSISKQLSPSVATSVSSTQPLKAQQDASYYWNVAFSF